MPDRIKWIDALRGFVMFAVVLFHVLILSFGLEQQSSVICILRYCFDVPLFFFVSGYFLYRPLSDWNGERVRHALKSRTLTLLLGTLVFSNIYFAGRSGMDTFCWLPDGNFGYFWFTISLFQMFLSYLLAVGLAKLTRPWVLWVILIGVSIAGFAWVGMRPGEEWYTLIYNSETFTHTPYFVMGMLMRRFRVQTLRLLDNPKTLSVLTITFLGSLYFAYITPDRISFYIDYRIYAFARGALSRVAGTLLVLNIFYIYRDRFDRPSPGINFWLFIGRRTIDIYLLHYFFIPWMTWLKPYLSVRNTILPELAAGSVVALAVILCCLGLSALLRRCPIIRLLLNPNPKKAATQAAECRP